MSARFEDDLATQEWQRAYTESNPDWPLPNGSILPIGLRIRDLDSGKSADLKPAVAYEADDRRRWGGRDLNVDWVLVLDRATDSVHRAMLSIQLKAADPRVLQLEVGPRIDTADWTLYSAENVVRIERSLSETSDTVPSRLGAQGERARLPFGVVEGPAMVLMAGVDPAEPRLFQITARPEDSFFGIRFEVALSPNTSNFPGRAAFHCAFAAWPKTADTYAFEQANEIWQFLWPSPENSEETIATNTSTQATVETTEFPLVFSPRIRDAQSTDLQSAWTLHVPPNSNPDALGSLEQALATPTLDELDNLARDARVGIKVDSTESGLSPESLADGVTQANVEDATTLGWSSDDTATIHRIHVDFPSPTAISELRLYWPVVAGEPRSARTLRIAGITGAGDLINIAQIDQPDPTDTTRLAIPSFQLQRLTIEMPAGGGAPDSPNQLWLCEMELR